MKYPTITPGYIGALQKKNQTLNSRFLSLYAALPESIKSHKKIIFPQRIPRLDFFEELFSLEGPDYQRRFERYKRSALRLTMKRLEEGNGIAAINQANLLLRLGAFDSVQKISEKIQRHKTPFDYEISLLGASAEIYSRLASGKTIDLRKLNSLNKKLKIKKGPEFQMLQLRVCVRILVYGQRLPGNSGGSALRSIVRTLENGLEVVPASTFESRLLRLMILRGLPMAPATSPIRIGHLMKQLVDEFLELKPADKLETLLLKEYEYVMCQTLSKWYFSNDKRDSAYRALKRMIHLDSRDSTGFSELGFFFEKTGNTKAAKANFLKASRLGPPALGMNLFFAATTGRVDPTLLKRAIKADPFGVSAYLALIEYYSPRNFQLAREYAQLVRAQKHLWSQLNKDEREKLTHLLR